MFEVEEFKAEIEKSQMELFAGAGFEVGYYGNQHKRSQSNWEWYQSAPDSQTRGVRYYPAVFFYEEDTAKVVELGVNPNSIAPVGH